MKIAFGEIDYRGLEGEGQAQVLVTQSEPITESLTIPIRAVTFAEFFGSGRMLTEHFDDVDLPDPAECKL